MKKLLVFGSVVALLLGSYLFLGGLDAAHPAPPDLDTGNEAPAADGNDWYAAFCATTNLVALDEAETAFVRAAAREAPSWWRWSVPPSASEEDAWERIDGILLRHDGLFAHLAASAQCTGWQPPSEKACLLVDIRTRTPAVDLLDLRISRELVRGETDAALRDLAVLDSLCAAVKKNGGNVIDWFVAAGVWHRSLRRVLAQVAVLDAGQLETLQKFADGAAHDEAVSCARAYARGVRSVEAWFAWHFRPDEADEPVVRTAREILFRFTFHMNRTLADYYDEAVKTHACLLRGRFDSSLRALRDDTRQPHRWMRYARLLLPNAEGSATVHDAVAARADLCDQLANELFASAADRLAVAANRFSTATGSYPAALQDLVPDYLDAVPADPYGDGPIGYNPGQRTIHSVGTDGGFDGVLPPPNRNGAPRTVKTIRRLDGQPLK